MHLNTNVLTHLNTNVLNKTKLPVPMAPLPLPHTNLPFIHLKNGPQSRHTNELLPLHPLASTASLSPSCPPPYPFAHLPSPDDPTPLMMTHLAQMRRQARPMTQWMPEIAATWCLLPQSIQNTSCHNTNK